MEVIYKRKYTVVCEVNPICHYAQNTQIFGLRRDVVRSCPSALDWIKCSIEISLTDVDVEA